MAPREDDCPPAVGEEAGTEEEEGGSYPDGEKETGKEDDLLTELTLDELKEAFRLFDDLKEGFITIDRFRVSDCLGLNNNFIISFPGHTERNR